MRVCCTANASSVGPTNDKIHGGEVGVLKNEDGKPANLNVTDFLSSWNNTYMKNTRLKMLAVLSAIKKNAKDTRVSVSGKLLIGHSE